MEWLMGYAKNKGYTIVGCSSDLQCGSLKRLGFQDVIIHARNGDYDRLCVYDFNVISCNTHRLISGLVKLMKAGVAVDTLRYNPQYVAYSSGFEMKILRKARKLGLRVPWV